MNIATLKILSNEEIEQLTEKEIRQKFAEIQDIAKQGNEILKELSRKRNVLEAMLFLSLNGKELRVSKKTINELYNTFIIKMMYDPVKDEYIIKGE